MPSDRRLIALGITLLACTAGCTSTGELKLGQADNWGEANRQTFAAQIINPAPEYADAFAPHDGSHAAQAIERYRTDKVKAPERQSLSDIGKSGKGGSGGSPGGN